MSLHQESMDVLRHVAVHGQRTRAEIVKAFPLNPGAGKTLENLSALGYVTSDGMSTPKAYILTKKARDKLSKADAPAAPRTQLRSATPTPASTPTRQDVPIRRSSAPGHYTARECAASNRPGAMDAFTLPSRVGSRLHYRGGRTTDIDGNPLP